MIHSLQLDFKQRAEVLERILRVVRHRGFHVVSMEMRLVNTVDAQLAMHVESERAVELLSNQLLKLVDVETCRILP